MTQAPKLYRVTDPTNGGALIMVAPLSTIGAAFGLDTARVYDRVTHEVATRGICDLHFNGKRPLGFTQVDVSEAK